MPFDIKVSYWNNSGARQESYDRLAEALIPSMGDCATVEGELLRAVSKIYYDFYNNGFGNDMRGPVAFLMDKYNKPEFASLYGELADRAPESRMGHGLDRQGLEDLVTSVITHIYDRAGHYLPLNGDGMWSYRDRIEDQPYEDEEYEDEDEA